MVAAVDFARPVAGGPLLSTPVNSGLLGVALLVMGLLVLLALVVVIVLLARRSTPDPHPAAHPAPRRDPFEGGQYDTAGDPRRLKVGDVVEYLGQRFFVRGSLRFREGGFTWAEHFVDDGSGDKRWVSVEEDPDLEVVMWSELKDPPPGAHQRVVTVDGIEYRRTEHGTAEFVGEGATGVGERGQAEYADFEGPAGRYLAFERFGAGAAAAGLGERVPAGALTIYPGS